VLYFVSCDAWGDGRKLVRAIVDKTHTSGSMEREKIWPFREVRRGLDEPYYASSTSPRVKLSLW